VFENSEVEPFIASNPLDPTNLIGVWQQDRWNTAAAHGLVAGYSFDGGMTWGTTTLPFSHCAPGGLAYGRATDPWVSIGPDGTAYAIALAASDYPDGPNAMVTATSVDGGQTWGTVRTIRRNNDGSRTFNDKESITADPVKAGVAYAVWDVIKPLTSGGHFRGPSLFSLTTDWGNTWSAPKPIASRGIDEGSINNIIVVDPADGTLYNFYTQYWCICWSIPRIEFVKSTEWRRHVE
jgi:hypothetical protein